MNYYYLCWIFYDPALSASIEYRKIHSGFKVEPSSIFDEIVLPAIIGQKWQESHIFINICKRNDLLVVDIPLEILRDSTVEVSSTTAVVSRTKKLYSCKSQCCLQQVTELVVYVLWGCSVDVICIREYHSIHAKNVWCCGEGYFGQKKIAEKVRKSRQNVNRDKSA